MSDPTTGREALVAELIGDVATLLNKVDKLAPALKTACAEIVGASAGLQDHAEKTNESIVAMAEAAKVAVVKHIARQADQIARSAAEQRTRAAEIAIREILRAELTSAVHRLEQAASIKAGHWWTYLATAAAASLATAAVMLWLLPF